MTSVQTGRGDAGGPQLVAAGRRALVLCGGGITGAMYEVGALAAVDDFLGAMGEIHRVARPGAMVNILVPHFSSGAAFVDPTHKQRLSARSCDYFIGDSSIEKDYGFYVPWRYELIRCFVEVAPAYRYFPGAAWLAQRHTAFWEDYLCYVLRGAGIFWQLKVVK